MPITKLHIQRTLLTWYRRHGRRLPWRGIKDPYRILVSEIMLQQTQVARVLVKYPEFIRKFPSFRTLAAAPTSSVITAWRGMGYNNRAIRLQQLARAVLERHNGRLPFDIATLLELPGVGPYTAHAIASFASRLPVATVDTNIRRVLIRLFPQQVARNGEWAVAAWLLPPRRSYDWNQTLMDLGALVCTASSPDCTGCPLNELCPSAFKSVNVPSGKKGSERLIDGLPNRIYRGRIVERLRNTFPASVRDELLGIAVRPGYTIRDLPWLQQLLEALARDGIISVRRRGAHFYASLVQ